MARLFFASSLRTFPSFSHPSLISSSFPSPLFSLASTTPLRWSGRANLSTEAHKREPFLASRFLADSVLEAVVEHPSLTTTDDNSSDSLQKRDQILGTEQSPNIEALVRWPKEQKGAREHHFTCHAAHKYSRVLGCGAEELSDHVTNVLNEKCSELGLSSVARGNGFLTFTLSDEILREVVYSFALSSSPSPIPSTPFTDSMNSCLQKSSKWAKKIKKGSIAIDYASPNAAKELHAGHMRSLVIGESLSRLLRATGSDVDGFSHVGDFGTPIGLVLGECFLSNTSPQAVNASELSGLYVSAKNKSTENASFYEFAKKICLVYQRMLLLEGGEEVGEVPSLEFEGRVWEAQEVMDGWSTILEKSRHHFEEIFDRFSVAAVERGESSYVHYIPKVMQEMQDKGILKETDGAKVVWFDDWDTPLIVQKKDGGYLYSTTDLAAGYERLIVKNYDRCIYVTDAGQAVHFKKVFETLRALGWVREGATLEHAPFGVVRFPKGGKLSSRGGGAETLQSLLNNSFEAAERAIPVAQSLLRCERVPANDEERTLVDEPTRGIENDVFTSERVEKLGVAALRYFELTHRKSSDYELNLGRMLSFNSNSIVYVMYAFTRIQSIITRYLEHHQLSELDYENIMENRAVLGASEEKKLAFWISQFDDQVYAGSMLLLPNIITEYTYNLAKKFHSFYEACRIIGSDRDVELSRLQMALATRAVLKESMNLLAIDTIDRL